MQVQQHETLDWKLSFVLEDGRTLITDKCILIDDRYVFADPLPSGGRCGQYKKAENYWSRPFGDSFGFEDLTVRDDGHYEDSEGLILNSTYIAFLLQRIPGTLLRFAKTDGNEAPVFVFRGEERMALLMPYRILPPFSPELIARAKAGCAAAQLFLADVYQMGLYGVPVDYFEAKRWLEAAVEQGHAGAMLELGKLYVKGAAGGDARGKALALFDRAIGLGCKDAARWRNGVRDGSIPTLSDFFATIRRYYRERGLGGDDDAIP